MSVGAVVLEVHRRERLLWVLFVAVVLGLAGCGGKGRRHVPEEGVREVTTASGTTLAYFEEGQGPLVVMWHGFPDTPHTWDGIRPRLAAAGFRVVTPWLKGYTPSSTPSDPAAYQAEALGRDVIELLDALEAERAILVGHDWGATAVMAAALLAPERVEKLVSMAIPHQAVSVDPLFLWRARHFLTLATDEAEDIVALNDFASVEVYFKRWSPLWQAPEDEIRAVKNCYADPASTTGAVNYYRALWRDGPPAPFMKDPITVPTLAFAGMSDGIVTDAMWEQTYPHFTGGYALVKLSGGHWVHRENEEEVLSFLLPFLADDPLPMGEATR